MLLPLDILLDDVNPLIPTLTQAVTLPPYRLP